ncbi:MAG: biotin--[acetyl-CoA-carboxylase] ligase, partial [Thermodesulfovibrionales bacterium]
KVIFKEEVGSTNDLAMELLGPDEKNGIVIMADSQTSGRGRLGRPWYSPAGKNIYMSLALRPNLRLQNASILTVLTGVAVCKGIKDCTGIDVNLKWPNDLILKNKKLGGILIETRVEKEVVIAAVIGIGININIDENEFPEDIKNIDTSIVIETGLHYGREEIAFSVLRAFDMLFRDNLIIDDKINEADINSSASMKLIQEWRELDITLGKRVSVITSNEKIVGKAVDIDEMCRLKILTDAGNDKLIHSGDVSLLL